MTDDTQWTDWIEHKAGEPCPIPDAKGGEFEIRYSDGFTFDPTNIGAVECEWGFDAHYRLRKPPVDWKGIADELVMALEKADEELASIPYRKSQWPRPKMSDALARYREAIK